MVYSANVSRPGADGLKGDRKRNGNVQSLLEAFRPNGLNRRLPRVSKAARDTKSHVRS